MKEIFVCKIYISVCITVTKISPARIYFLYLKIDGGKYTRKEIDAAVSKCLQVVLGSSISRPLYNNTRQ